MCSLPRSIPIASDAMSAVAKSENFYPTVEDSQIFLRPDVRVSLLKPPSRSTVPTGLQIPGRACWTPLPWPPPSRVRHGSPGRDRRPAEDL